ncbi:hypothetical protein GCM10010483_47810 [Actinokineospora diospyrosa]
MLDAWACGADGAWGFAWGVRWASVGACALPEWVVLGAGPCGEEGVRRSSPEWASVGAGSRGWVVLMAWDCGGAMGLAPCAVCGFAWGARWASTGACECALPELVVLGARPCGVGVAVLWPSLEWACGAVGAVWGFAWGAR